MAQTEKPQKRTVNRTIKRKDSIGVMTPGGSTAFSPTYKVTEVYGVERGGADFVYARLTPQGGGAGEVGLITLRMPALLAEDGSLGTFARAVGQDPRKGFDPEAAVGKYVRFTLGPLSDATE